MYIVSCNEQGTVLLQDLCKT